MSQKIYVGNLPYSASDADLQQNFSAFGDVVSATVMTDRDTGRSKGFGFVEMSSPAQAQAAIEGLNGQSVSGRALVVNLARPRDDSGPRGGGGGGYRSGNGGGYRGGGGRY
ncbi:MAG: RNA-binding protein [Ottowia sp.]|jgi:cold-inducible RNA-binding protein|uniref:RNA recognition motif domain-containing protein n=1 Tax=Ottowia beijingensis TaxID=1207057 RepID=UPI001B777121|nr:RNA-binding protein [Ottowia sp.]MBP7537989.1 RNA-binding protein [Ottowia sp.]MBP9953601.1 RNA-binding protein [Ottowia sp.]HRL37928.1 RNA-binding protein [Ottowia beijingensis]